MGAISNIEIVDKTLRMPSRFGVWGGVVGGAGVTGGRGVIGGVPAVGKGDWVSNITTFNYTRNWPFRHG